MHAATNGRAPRAKSARQRLPQGRRRTSALRIAVANQQQIVQIKASQLIKTARVVLSGEGLAAAEISIALVDDATIQTIHRDFLQHDFPTDVITFVLGDEGGVLEGEIVASAETAHTVALRHGVPPADELALYVIHGALHLAGYDDLSAAPRARMRERERHYLGKLGLDLVPVGADPDRVAHNTKRARYQIEKPSRGGRGGTTRRRTTNRTHGASAT